MRYFISFLIGIGLVVLVIILLIRAIFGGGGAPEPQTDLADSYAQSNVIMRLTIDGPINSEEVHKQVRIDVSQYSSELRIVSGYEGRVDETKRFTSNPEAYGTFLRALDQAGFTKGTDNEELKDERGYCPFGQRYILEIIDGTSAVQRYWDTSCEETRSFHGNTETVLGLFQAQIPEYEEIIGQADLNF